MVKSVKMVSRLIPCLYPYGVSFSSKYKIVTRIIGKMICIYDRSRPTQMILHSLALHNLLF